MNLLRFLRPATPDGLSPGESGGACAPTDHWVRRHPATAAFLLTWIYAFTVYFFSLPPHLTLGLGGIHAANAPGAGVPHPPGYPVWSLYSSAFAQLIPFGNVAWRVALSSAVAGALAAALVAASLHRLSGALLDSISSPRLPDNDELWLKIISSFAGASAFAFSTPVWQQAITPEPHAFGLLLWCGAWHSLQRWFLDPAPLRHLLLGAFLFGMAVVNNQWLFVAAPALILIVARRAQPLARDLSLLVSVLLLTACLGELRGGWVPQPFANLAQVHNLHTTYLLFGLGTLCLGVALVIRTRRFLTSWTATAAVFGAFFLPFLGYLYSPLASMANPPVNWGYARSLEGFIHLVGRGQYEGIQPADSLSTVLHHLLTMAPAFLAGYSWIFVLPAILTFLFLRRIASLARAWILILWVPFACFTLLLVALLNPPPGFNPRDLVATFAAPAYLVAANWTACGLVLAGTRLARCRRARHGP